MGKTTIRAQLNDQRNKHMIEDDKDRNRLSNNKRTQKEEEERPNKRGKHEKYESQ